MSNFLDCARELEQCRQQQSAADELGGRLDATMNQQALWQANQGQPMGGGTGVPVEVLGYNNELGGYLVEERNGNISLMRSRSNAGLPTGAIVPAECEELVVPPAWVLSYVNQYPRSRRTGGYWFVYKIEYFDTGGELVRTEFWLGGASNLFIKEYVAKTNIEPVPIPNYSFNQTQIETSPDGGSGEGSISHSLTSDGTFTSTTSLFCENNGPSFGVSDSRTLNLLSIVLGGYDCSLTFSWVGNATSDPGTTYGGPVSGIVFQIRERNAAPIILAAAFDAQGNNTTPILQTRTKDGITEGVGSVDTSFSTLAAPQINLTSVVDTSTGGGINTIGFSISASASASFSMLANKNTDATVVSLSRSDRNVYLAIRYHPIDPELNPNTDNLKIDYFTINSNGKREQLFSNDIEIENGTPEDDWRGFFLELDSYNDGNPTGAIGKFSDNPCFNEYWQDRTANLIAGQLRKLDDLADLEPLKTGSTTISFSQQAYSQNDEECSLGTGGTISKFATQLTGATLKAGEASSQTTILWAAL